MVTNIRDVPSNRFFRVMAIVGLACSCTRPASHGAIVRYPVDVPASAVAALDSVAGAALFTQCSRTVPTRTGELFVVPQDQVAAIQGRLAEEIERQLERLIAPESPRGTGLLRDTVRYAAQVIGFEANGDRRIYVNGLAIEPGASRDTVGWRGRAVNVCDGGADYFGVVYDPGKGTFD